MSLKFTDNPKETLYIYSRVSTTQQSEDCVSLSVQSERGRKVSKKLKLSPIVTEEQGSGLKAFQETRPLFEQLYDGITEGMVENVWIDEETRLTRFDIDQTLIHFEMKRNNVNLYVGNSKEPKKWDFITDLVDTIITKVNQHQIRTQVKKSIRSKVKLFNEGKYMKGQPPFGYKIVDKKLEIDEEKSKWVKKIYNWYNDGKSTLKIRDELFVNQIKPSRSSRGFFPLRSLIVILSNQNYIGRDIYTDKSTGIIHTNDCPQIIDKELFEGIQKKINFNKGQYTKRRKDYLLRGIVKCPDGTPMYCKGLNNTNKHELYSCNHNQRKYKKRKYESCEITKSLRMNDLNDYVWDLLCNTLSMSSTYKEEIKKEILGDKPQYSKRSHNLKIKNLNKELMESDERKMTLDTRYYSGEMNEKKYQTLTSIIDNKESELLKEIDKQKFQLLSLNKKKEWVDWLQIHFNRIEDLRGVDNYEEKRKWILRYINEVIVLDYNKETRQHTIVLKFKIPLFNDKLVWVLNKDGSHKTDKWGRWIYEVLDGKKDTINPFTLRKSLNRKKFCKIPR